jgi:hypothetical protein
VWKLDAGMLDAPLRPEEFGLSTKHEYDSPLDDPEFVLRLFVVLLVIALVCALPSLLSAAG